jgi:hypothetical protein
VDKIMGGQTSSRQNWLVKAYLEADNKDIMLSWRRVIQLLGLISSMTYIRRFWLALLW